MTLTKTKTMFLFAGLSVALMLPFSLIEMEESQTRHGIPYAEATPNQNAHERTIQNTPNENANERATNNGPPPESGLVPFLKDFEFKSPRQINENALNGLKIAVAKNPQVKELLGDDFEYVGYHQYYTEDGWQPEINYRTDNGEYTVTVTMDKGRVVDAVKYETITWGLNDSRGFAIDQYDEDRWDATGMLMIADVPDYTHTSGSFTALLVNAQKEGSNNYDVCDSSKFPTSYWGQVGINFNENGARIGYTDTAFGCEPVFFNSLPYNTGDNIIFAIYVIDETDEWFLYAYNQDDSSPPYAYVRVVPGSSFIDTTNTRNTSVFFENSNHWWNGDWASGFASDPVVDIAAWQYTNGGWYVWFDENQIPWNCDIGTTASHLMHGTFVGSPYDVTFDVSEIQERCPVPEY